MPCVKVNLLPQPSQPDFAVQFDIIHQTKPPYTVNDKSLE